MRKKLIFSLMISVLCYFSVAGQNNSNSTLKDGLQRINVSTIQGTITVNLPAEIHSGDQISGTVSVIPSKTGTRKKDKKRAKKNKEALEKYTVSFNQNSIPISDETLGLIIKNTNDSQELAIYDEKGTAIAKIPVAIINEKRTDNIPNIQFPNYLRAGNTCYIKGDFDGVSNNSEVMLGDTPIAIVAESPDRIICEVPNTVSGLQKITVTENGITNSASCNVVKMNLSVGKLNLLKGESTNLTIEVFGLEGIEVPIEILVENKTQENISLSGGDIQNITIYPNQVSTEGTYNKTIQVQSKRAGNYTIDVTLIQSFDDPTEDNSMDASEIKIVQNPDVLTNNISIPNHLITYNPSSFSGYNFSPYTLSAGILPNVLFSFNVMIDDDEKRKLRNKGRKLPENAPLGPTAPDDKKSPYSRPIPTGIKAPVHEEFPGVWETGDKLLKEANKEIKRAKAHKGEIVVGVPGIKVIGVLNAHKETINNQRGCTEDIYIFYQRLRYIDDRTLVMEEQLSPSKSFFMAKGENKLSITKKENGWSVTPSIAADVKGVSIGIEGSYWGKTTHTTAKGSSNLIGRNLWMFHIGRLYLYRKAFLRIKYEYHYEVCNDGSTRNWVITTYTDHWHYRYEWEEEIVIASKDNEGNFHRVDGFPNTVKTRDIGGGETLSYEVDGLESKYFENFGLKGWDFFPAISKK